MNLVYRFDTDVKILLWGRMLREVISRVLGEYKLARKQPLAGHPVAHLVTKTLPDFIARLLNGGDRYKVEGSVGKGNWAGCPWVSIFDISITETAQAGYYPVYLFREDMTGLYLSLNQGVTDIRETHKENPRKVLAIQAANYRAKIGSLPGSFLNTEIDLRSRQSQLASFYEPGNICARFYASGELPTEKELINDLLELVHVYELLVDNDKSVGDDMELLWGTGTEDLRQFRYHKRLERNRKLAEAAKKYHGYSCQACNFSFEKTYGTIGKEFIEAHHLRSLSKLKGAVVALNIQQDFAVLCSNCHRMIHRISDPSDIAAFKTFVKQ